MQLGFHNRMLALGMVLTTSLCAVPATLHAEDMQAFLQNPAGKGIILAIATLNKAMLDAAENPMDQWRRQEVQRAVAALPAAMVALGQEYKAVNLDPFQFPKIQAMLGGFVDVNAADNYKKFMVNPDKRLIPKVGSDFPQKALKSAGAQVASAGPLAPKTSASPDNAATMGLKDATSGSDDPASAIAQAAASPEKGKKKDQTSIGYDDNAAKNDGSTTGDPLVDATVVGPNGSFTDTASQDSGTAQGQLGAGGQVYGPAGAAPATMAGSSSASSGASGAMNGASSPMSEYNRELSSIQANVDSQNVFTEDFFQKIRHSGEAKANTQKGRPVATPDAYKLDVKPKFWNVVPIWKLMENAFETESHAEDDGGGKGQRAQAAGMIVAQMLFGAAAIISAISPMVVANTQANADMTIAGINAATQIAMTNTTANTSKYLADQQANIALTQSSIAQQISAQNNAGVTQRLSMQLAELSAARQDAQQAEEEKRQLDYQYNQERIQLAQKQANDNLSLAKETLNAQLTQAGLSQGFSNSINSGNQLGVTRTGLAGAGGPTGSALAQAGGGLGGRAYDGSATGGDEGNSAGSGPSLGLGNGSGTGLGGNQALNLNLNKGPALAMAGNTNNGLQTRAAITSQLLKGISSGAGSASRASSARGGARSMQSRSAIRGGGGGAGPAAPHLGVLVSNKEVSGVGGKLSAALSNILVANPIKSGSTATNRAYVPGVGPNNGKSDLSGYLGVISGSNSSFASDLRREDVRGPASVASSTKSSVEDNNAGRRIRTVGGGYEQAPEGSYNAPKDSDDFDEKHNGSAFPFLNSGGGSE